MDAQHPEPLASVIAQEVEELRSRFPDTQSLYREVCALLFFRHGITPTANKLYQLVRKGSMSAPAEALSRFWEQLRQKSRVRIEQPDLPPELAQIAGEMIGALWQRAQAGAQASFQEAMDEARKTIDEAQVQASTELARAETAAHALFQLQAEFSATLTRLQELEQSLARERGVRESLERQLASAVTQQREMQEALASTRRDFDAQMQAQQNLSRVALAHHQGEIERLTGESARERSRAESAAADLVQARQDAEAQSERHAAALGDRQAELSRLREALGLSEGAATELRAARDNLQRQLDVLLLQGRPAMGRRRGRIVRAAQLPMPG